MIKEGEKDVTLNYLSASPKRNLAINSFTDGMLPPVLLHRTRTGVRQLEVASCGNAGAQPCVGVAALRPTCANSVCLCSSDTRPEHQTLLKLSCAACTVLRGHSHRLRPLRHWPHEGSHYRQGPVKRNRKHTSPDQGAAEVQRAYTTVLVLTWI